MSDTMTKTKQEELREKVFEALGAASVCWGNMEGAGVFDSDRAKAIGEQLLLDIDRLAVADLRAENERLHRLAYFTVPIPRWLRRKR